MINLTATYEDFAMSVLWNKTLYQELSVVYFCWVTNMLIYIHRGTIYSPWQLKLKRDVHRYNNISSITFVQSTIRLKNKTKKKHGQGTAYINVSITHVKHILHKVLAKWNWLQAHYMTRILRYDHNKQRALHQHRTIFGYHSEPFFRRIVYNATIWYYHKCWCRILWRNRLLLSLTTSDIYHSILFQISNNRFEFNLLLWNILIDTFNVNLKEKTSNVCSAMKKWKPRFDHCCHFDRDRWAWKVNRFRES